MLQELPKLRQRYSPDFVVANVDNISSWRWPIDTHLKQLEKAGVDVMCSGDHFFDNQKEIIEYMAHKNCNLIRPANFYDVEGFPIMWKGYKIVEKNGMKLCVIHLMGQVFMRFDVYNPFLRLKEILEEKQVRSCDAIIVDFHKEATAEIVALWRYFDGKVSAVYWTHTHIQTNDEIILDEGTAYITDVWMTGPKKSIIWAEIDGLKSRFFTGVNPRIVQSLDQNFVLWALYLEIDSTSNKALFIEKIKVLWTL